MRFGSIQKNILMFLYEAGEKGAFIGSTTKAKEFRGYNLNQVMSSLQKLIKRGIIYKEGIRYILKPSMRNWCYHDKNCKVA